MDRRQQLPIRRRSERRSAPSVVPRSTRRRFPCCSFPAGRRILADRRVPQRLPTRAEAPREPAAWSLSHRAGVALGDRDGVRPVVVSPGATRRLS